MSILAAMVVACTTDDVRSHEQELVDRQVAIVQRTSRQQVRPPTEEELAQLLIEGPAPAPFPLPPPMPPSTVGTAGRDSLMTALSQRRLEPLVLTIRRIDAEPRGLTILAYVTQPVTDAAREYSFYVPGGSQCETTVDPRDQVLIVVDAGAMARRGAEPIEVRRIANVSPLVAVDAAGRGVFPWGVEEFGVLASVAGAES